MQAKELSQRTQIIRPTIPDKQYPFTRCACGCQQILLAYNKNGRAVWFVRGHMRGEFMLGKWRKPATDTRELEMLTYEQARERGAEIRASDMATSKKPPRGKAVSSQGSPTTSDKHDIARFMRPKDVRRFYEVLRDIALGVVTFEKWDAKQMKAVELHPGPSESALIYLLNQVSGAPRPKRESSDGGATGKVVVYLPERRDEADMPPEIAAKVQQLKQGDGLTVDTIEKLNLGAYAPDQNAMADIQEANDEPEP